MSAVRIYIIPLIIALFSGVVIVLALQLDKSPPMIVGDSMQPRSFPIFLMVLNLVLVAFLVWQFRRNPPAAVPLEPISTWGSIVLFGVFYVLTVTVDMFIAIAVVMLLMCWLWGERRIWVALSLAIVTPLTIFLVFDSVLKIRFPRGLFTNWWYS
jgi:hypothetical protein